MKDDNILSIYQLKIFKNFLVLKNKIFNVKICTVMQFLYLHPYTAHTYIYTQIFANIF